MKKRIIGLFAATLLALSMMAAPAMADGNARGCENMKPGNPVHDFYC